MPAPGQKRAEACVRCSAEVHGQHLMQLCASCAADWKWCGACERVKPRDAFRAPGGRSYGHCYECHGRLNRQRGSTPQRQHRFYVSHLRRKFGITREEAEALAAVRVCQACGWTARDAQDARRRLHVDHDHVTKLVRGVLCVRCNHAAPLLEDPEWEAQLRAYLTRANVSG